MVAVQSPSCDSRDRERERERPKPLCIEQHRKQRKSRRQQSLPSLSSKPLNRNMTFPPHLKKRSTGVPSTRTPGTRWVPTGGLSPDTNASEPKAACGKARKGQPLSAVSPDKDDHDQDPQPGTGTRNWGPRNYEKDPGHWAPSLTKGRQEVIHPTGSR